MITPWPDDLDARFPNAVVAVAEIEEEEELEMAWAEVALTCDCHECASALLMHDASSVMPR